MEPVDPFNQNQFAQHTGAKANDNPKDTQAHVPTALPVSQSHPAEAQQRSASAPEKNWWDKAKPWIEFVGVSLLAIYTGFTIAMYFANKESADAAKSAADTAARQLELSARPWVSIKANIAGPLIFNKSALKQGHPRAPVVSINVAFTLTNVGGSPAQKTWIEIDPVITNYRLGWIWFKQRQERMSRFLRKNPTTLGDMVFPREPLPVLQNVFTEVAAIELQTMKESTDRLDLTKSMYFDIMGCVTYQYQFMPTVFHQTGFVLHLVRHGNDKAFVLNPNDTTVPVSELSIQQDSRFNYAD